jgi:hypothetical protein
MVSNYSWTLFLFERCPSATSKSQEGHGTTNGAVSWPQIAYHEASLCRFGERQLPHVGEDETAGPAGGTVEPCHGLHCHVVAVCSSVLVIHMGSTKPTMMPWLRENLTSKVLACTLCRKNKHYRSDRLSRKSPRMLFLRKECYWANDINLAH